MKSPVVKVKKILVICCLAALSSCAVSPEERARRAERARIEEEAKLAAERQKEYQRRAAIESQCLSYGFSKGTVSFSECVMKIDVAQKEAAARQSQINQQRAQLESQCDYIKGQAYLAPTRTGNFWESNNNAMAAYNNCMAGLPPPRSVNVICNRQGSNQIACFSQ
jgi:hypothetical protein